MRVDLTQRGDTPAAKTAGEYQVRSIPDIRILDADGKQLANPSSKADIIAAMKKALGK